jgi:hypothetical protein
MPQANKRRRAAINRTGQNNGGGLKPVLSIIPCVGPEGEHLDVSGEVNAQLTSKWRLRSTWPSAVAISTRHMPLWRLSEMVW